MYSRVAFAPGAVAGPSLALTGLNLVYTGLVTFVLIGAGFAVARCLPKRHTS
jgi:hypothetical protein